MVKQKIYNLIQEQLQERIHRAKELMDSHKEALQSDTKSTAGDKHETGRAMVQMEYEGSIKQWKKALEMKNALDRIDPTVANNTIGLGSLVITNQGNFYVSVSLGKISLKNESYFAVSFASPLGNILRGKKVGDEFTFMQKHYVINAIK